MWTFEFEAPVQSRFMRYYVWCTTFDNLWWCNASKKFVVGCSNLPAGGSSCSPPIRTFRAFKRFLRKHPELRGVDVILQSRFHDHNVTARWVEPA
jgi:hypothetical protein